MTRLEIREYAKSIRESRAWDRLATMAAVCHTKTAHEVVTEKTLDPVTVRAFIDVMAPRPPIRRPLDPDDPETSFWVMFTDAFTDANMQVTDETMAGFYSLPKHEQLLYLSLSMKLTRVHTNAQDSFEKTVIYRRAELTLREEPKKVDVVLGQLGNPQVGARLLALSMQHVLEKRLPVCFMSYMVPGDGDPIQEFSTQPRERQRIAVLILLWLFRPAKE